MLAKPRDTASPVRSSTEPHANLVQIEPAGDRDSARSAWTLRVAALALLIAGAVVPAWLAGLAPAPPRTREIHIEAYRYGFSPSRIFVNRGDRLRLTFSTRDTGQSFFLQDYDLHVSITPGDKRVAVQHLSRPDEPPQFVETVEFVAALPGWQGQLTSKSQFRNHTYNGPLHGTERGDLIVAPNYLLWGGLGVMTALPFALLLLRPRQRGERRFNLFALLPPLKKLLKAPSFQFNLALPMLAVFWFIILAGFAGTKVAGRNAGPMITWVLWLSALIVVLVPIGGRIWCTACPLPLIGEWLQRRRLARDQRELEGLSRRRILGIPLIWPGWLSNTWPRVLLFLLLGTFSNAIVALPPATSWMLLGLMAMATAVSIFPEQRLFCRYLCPINSYISLYSTVGRVMVRTVSPEPCSSCTERFCLTGSAKGWGCPYGLCAGELDRNNDCGACMECVKTCAYDNVAVFWRNTGRDQTIASYGEAWQAIVMFSLACLYCITNFGAWDKVRDWIDIIDKRNWATFAVYAAAVWAICLGILPLFWFLGAKAGLAFSGSGVDARVRFRETSAALIPIGLGVWIAFALGTALSMMTFVLQSLSDPFNWGWNLLGMAGSRWHIVWSAAIPWLQVAAVVIGSAYALQTLFECWGAQSNRDRQEAASFKRTRALAGAAPLASLVWIAAAGMIWFFGA